MDLRVVTMDVSKQAVMTRDNVPATVDAVVYFRVVDPVAAVVKVENFWKATSLIARTTLRTRRNWEPHCRCHCSPFRLQAIRTALPAALKRPIVFLSDCPTPASIKRMGIWRGHRLAPPTVTAIAAACSSG